MVIDQGNFHIVDNNIISTNTWELAHLQKPAEPYLTQSVDFISDRRFLTIRIPKSWQNFRSIAVLHVCIEFI